MRVVRVWVDGWQVECCGEPFAVGDTVRWTLVERPLDDVLVDERGRPEPRPTLAEEHHGDSPDGAPVTEGVVRRIAEVTFAYDPIPGRAREWGPVEGSGRTRQRWRVDGREGDLPTDEGRRFAGYVVDLDVAAVPPDPTG